VADPAPRNPVALVVGAGDYIGGAIAKRFAAGGYVAALGRRKADQLAPLVEEIEKSGGRAHAFGLDARDEENVQSVFAAIERDLGPLEVVVYNPAPTCTSRSPRPPAACSARYGRWRASAASCAGAKPRA
jgi:NAD(P)-dependent dehydrogenase (short-subunit alcohol dehydrogenase family)